MLSFFQRLSKFGFACCFSLALLTDFCARWAYDGTFFSETKGGRKLYPCCKEDNKGETTTGACTEKNVSLPAGAKCEETQNELMLCVKKVPYNYDGCSHWQTNESKCCDVSRLVGVDVLACVKLVGENYLTTDPLPCSATGDHCACADKTNASYWRSDTCCTTTPRTGKYWACP